MLDINVFFKPQRSRTAWTLSRFLCSAWGGLRSFNHCMGISQDKKIHTCLGWPRQGALIQPYMQRFWRINGIPQWRICCLDREVSQEKRVSLYAVTLLVIICSIKQFPRKIGPLTSHSFSIQLADLEQQLLKGEYSPSVNSLPSIAGGGERKTRFLLALFYLQTCHPSPCPLQYPITVIR